MMKIGFMLWSISQYIKSKGSLEQVLLELREMGLDGIEITESTLRQVGSKEFKDVADSVGLEVCAFDVICDLVTRDPIQRGKVVDDVERSMELAASLGCTRVLIVPGLVQPGLTPKHTREIIAEGLKDCVERADKLGIVPMIEDFGMPNTPFSTSAEILEVLDMVGEGLKVTFDTGNFLIGDEDPVEALEVLSSYVSHVHIKDMKSGIGKLRSYSGKAYKTVGIGEGEVDFKTILGKLKKEGYNGYLSLEVGTNDDEIKRGIRHIKDNM